METRIKIVLNNKINLPAIELVWVFLARNMKVETEVGVNADPKVVVHHEDRSSVFVQLRGVRVVCDRHLRLICFLLVRVENYCPTVKQSYRLERERSRSFSALQPIVTKVKLPAGEIAKKKLSYFTANCP